MEPTKTHAALPLFFALALAVPVTARADESPPAFSTSTSSASFAVLPSLYVGEGPDEGGPNRFSHFRIDVHGDFGWYGAAGVGMRVEFPLGNGNGILNGVDDELALSFGAELFYFYAPDWPGLGVYPIAAVQWTFFVGPNVSLFPEVGVAFMFGPNRQRYWGTFVGPYLGLGFRYHLNTSNALLVRASWPAGLQLGFTF